VANMYFIPTGLMIQSRLGTSQPGLTWGNFFLANLLPVPLGNSTGGVVLVAGACGFVHLRRD